jgi:hypothetical protein
MDLQHYLQGCTLQVPVLHWPGVYLTVRHLGLNVALMRQHQKKPPISALAVRCASIPATPYRNRRSGKRATITVAGMLTQADAARQLTQRIEVWATPQGGSQGGGLPTLGNGLPLLRTSAMLPLMWDGNHWWTGCNTIVIIIMLGSLPQNHKGGTPAVRRMCPCTLAQSPVAFL